MTQTNTATDQTTPAAEIDTSVKTYQVQLCQACIDGVGEECHTPGCILYLHSVDIPIMRELLTEVTNSRLNAREWKGFEWKNFDSNNGITLFCGDCFFGGVLTMTNGSFMAYSVTSGWEQPFKTVEEAKSETERTVLSELHSLRTSDEGKVREKIRNDALEEGRVQGIQETSEQFEKFCIEHGLSFVRSLNEGGGR